MLNLINKNQFDSIYELFESSFPACELREKEKVKELFENGQLKIYGSSDSLVAMYVWEFEKFVYLENFAVSSKYRGQGIGGKVLLELIHFFPSKTIVLEVEKPYDDMSTRRVGFYQRSGFVWNEFAYKLPPLRDVETDVDLHVMSYKNQLNQEDFNEIKEVLFKDVYMCRR